MKYRYLDLQLNVLIPLLTGLLIYLYKDELQLPTIISNYIPDGLWAYAFLSAILIVWQRSVNVLWCIMPFIVALLFEVFQYLQLVEGTGDIVDIVIYYVCFSVAISTNKFFKQLLKQIYVP